MDFDFTDVTLLEILQIILRDTVHLSHSQRLARGLFEATMRKYFACNEKERRAITRSDPEFISIVRDSIILRCGFNTEEEAYGEVMVTPEIPRINRGNELIWSPKGDPEEPETEQMEIIEKKLERLISIVLKKLQEIYPDEFERCNQYSKDPLIEKMSNSDKDKESIGALNTVSENYLNRTVLPKIITPIVMRVAEINSLNSTQQNEMNETILKAVWDLLV